MTYQQILEALEETDLPVVYNAWEIGNVPDLPYIVFTYPNNNDFKADDENYVEIVALNIELYSETKDIPLEKDVEEVLKDYFVFSKESIWLESEHMNETLYQTEVIING